MRVPQNEVAGTPRIKERAGGFEQPGSVVDRDRPRYTLPGTQNDYRTDARRHGTSGLIHIGTDPLRVGVGGHDGHYDPQRYHYRPYRQTYDPRHYYHGYRSIYYPGRRTYRPWYGYAYTSVYLTEPYVVPVYAYDDDPVVYYQETTPTVQTMTTAVEQAPSPELSAPSSGAAYPQPDGEDYQALGESPQAAIVSEGNAAFTAGRFEEARGLYTRAVLSDERDGYAKMLLGWASFAVGDFQGAATAIRRALLTTEDLVSFPMDLRTLYTDRALLDRQIASLNQYRLARPDDREADLVAAYLYFSIGEADRAAAMLQSMIERDREDTLLASLRDAVVRASRGQSAPPRP